MAQDLSQSFSTYCKVCFCKAASLEISLIKSILSSTQNISKQPKLPSNDANITSHEHPDVSA